VGREADAAGGVGRSLGLVVAADAEDTAEDTGAALSRMTCQSSPSIRRGGQPRVGFLAVGRAVDEAEFLGGLVVVDQGADLLADVGFGDAAPFRDQADEVGVGVVDALLEDPAFFVGEAPVGRTHVLPAAAVMGWN